MNKGRQILIPALLAGMSWACAAPVELSKEKAEELVDKLVEIDSFDTGFSSTHGGLDFPPVAGQFEFGVGRLFAPDPHARKKAVTHLVEAGPSVLPALLAHLNDDRATKLTVKHEGGFGGMWHSAEVPAPEHAKAEIEAIKGAKLPEEDFGNREYLDTYPVKVGDVCFAVIGMITNRSYNAVRYQPTACIVINSPVKTREIATAVREIWKDHADVAGLRTSLERDFDQGNEGAATRLLYYFPQEASPRVNARLKDLIAKKDDGLARFLNAVSWAEDPELRTQIRSLLNTTKDADFVVSGAAAFAESSNAERRDEVVKLFQRWKADKKDSECRAAAELLKLAMNTWADRAQDSLTAYLDKATRPAIVAGVRACYESGNAPVPALRRLLDDKREGFGYYLKDGKGVHEQPAEKDYRSYRICDLAYELICRNLGDRETTCTGEPAAMNKRIASLQARLSGDPTAWHFSEAEIAERQAAQGQSAAKRLALLEGIRKSEPDPARQAVLILEEDKLTLDDWKKAVATIYDYGSSDKEPDYRNVAINRRYVSERKFDTLDAEWQKRAALIMAKRCRGLGDPGNKARYPSEDEADFFLIACMRLPELNRELQAEYLAMLEAALSQHGFPESDDLEETLQVADDLIGFGTPGAAEWFAKLAAKVTLEALEGGFREREFFGVLSRHAAAPALQKTAETLFLAPTSPWNPAKVKYMTASELGDARSLRIPAFRKALLQALRDNPQRHQVTGRLSVKEGKAESCLIEWTGDATSSMSVDGPCGATPGAPMDLRQVDGLLCGLSGAVSMDGDKESFPEFRVYWPKDKRDEAIAKWIEQLAKE